MLKSNLFRFIIFISVVLPIIFGCAGKGKEIRTIRGDPELLYKQGLSRFNKRDYSEALKIFEQIKSSFPDSPPYTIWAELKVGDCHFYQKDYVEAIASYEEFKKIHPTHEDIPYVQFQIAMAYFNQMRTFDRDQTPTQKALSNFEYLVANYPPSIFTEKAKEKIEICRRQLADHEFYIGNFYFKKGNFKASASRFERLLESFPKSKGEDKTLYLLGKSYLELNQWEKAKEAFSRILKEYPGSSYQKEVRSILEQGPKEKKLSLFRSKPKAKEEESQSETEIVHLIKFDDEKRHPVPFLEEKGEASQKLTSHTVKLEEEEREIIKPKEGDKTDLSIIIPIEPEMEPKKDLIPPSSRPYGDQPILSSRRIEMISEERKGEMDIIIKPEDEGKIALNIPPKQPRGKDILEGEKTSTLPDHQVNMEEITKKQSSFESESKIIDTGEPIDITSDRVETYSRENLIIFRGNVMARQKDIVIYSDSLEATILDDGKGIEKVVAGGNVKIQQGLRVASCEKAVFYNITQKVILTGDPKLWEGENMVQGDEIIFDITENRVEVRGGTGGRGKVKIRSGGESEKLK